MSGSVTRTIEAEHRRSYVDLLREHQPRPIRCEEYADHIQEIMDAIMDAGEPTSDERDFLLLLGSLMAAWEENQAEPAAAPAHQVIKALLEARGLPQQALVDSVFPSKGIASEVLNGKRRLTYDYVQRLSEFFQLSPSVFYASAPSKKATVPNDVKGRR